MRIQPLIVAILQADPNVTAAATGGVWDRPIADERFAGDPLATLAALDHGTPMPCLWVSDPGAVPHPTESRSGSIDFWPEVNYLWPLDQPDAADAMREAVRAAIGSKRVLTTWGQVARLEWVEEPAPPVPHGTFPDTMTDFTRYRVTTRREDDTVDGSFT